VDGFSFQPKFELGLAFKDILILNFGELPPKDQLMFLTFEISKLLAKKIGACNVLITQDERRS